MMTLSLPPPAKLHPPLSLKPPNPSRLKFSSSSSPQSLKLKTRLIHLINTGHLNQAISALDLILQEPCATPLDLLTSYSLLLKSCIRLRNFELGKLLHAKLTHSQLEPDSVLLNSLISLYSKCGDPATANTIFENMGIKRDLVSWSAMISCFAHNSMELQAIVTFFEMLESGHCPNEYCFSAVIRACSNMEYVSIGRVIFGSVIKTGYFESDVCVGCALIDMFAKGGCDLDSAYKVFEQMPERNVVTWTLMITRFTQLGYPRDAIDLLLDMVLSEHVPDRFTLSGVISACAELELLSLGQQLHSRVIRSGLASDVCVGCSLVDMYAKCAGGLFCG
ncbi:hypothetical protein L1049_002042 [Liquidambar formosana]|uniref:Pentatricopeptide repeat-containing protein n=1 Tax=Liquidambar formosana TaxID=63359 RepID=A0AAP0R7Y8_LIQFO